MPDGLKTTRQRGVAKIRTFTRLNFVSDNLEVIPFNHNFDTLLRAVKERVFFVKENGVFGPPPKPELGVFENRLAPVFKSILPLLPKLAPISHDGFVSCYTGQKRVIYQNALDELRIGRNSIKKDAEVNVFVKFEKVDRTTKTDPVPRVISPRNPRYNIRLGRYLKPLEKKLFKSLSSLFGHNTVIKGMDNIQAAHCLREKWDMFKDPVAVGLDASRFDQHVSVDALRFEHKVYLQCFPNSKHKKKLSTLLECQLQNVCKGYCPDGRLSYITSGTRMSGDMNTSLGNCVLMCCMIKAYLLEKRVNGQLANNGDDCVVFMERKSLNKFMNGLSSWFRDMGFNMVVEEPVHIFEEIEFCQTKPVFDGTDWLLCRNPVKAICNDTVMLIDPQNDNKRNDLFRLWLNAVGLGGERLLGGLPIFQNLYRYFQRSGVTEYKSHGKLRTANGDMLHSMLPWYMRETHIKGKREFSEPTPECRASFAMAWDISPDMQLELERYYDSMTYDNRFMDEFMPRTIFV